MTVGPLRKVLGTFPPHTTVVMSAGPSYIPVGGVRDRHAYRWCSNRMCLAMDVMPVPTQSSEPVVVLAYEGEQ